MFDAELAARTFQSGLAYADFVASGEPEGHDRQWHQRYDLLALDEMQAAIVSSFTRSMNVLCMTGTWCGDCALQGAAMQRIAEGAGGRIDLRFANRNMVPELQVKLPVNAGYRVPMTLFMAEDGAPVARWGDRSLSRYRSMARKALGPDAPVSAPLPQDPVREVLTEVLEEFERVQLLLRLSPRLRQQHGD